MMKRRSGGEQSIKEGKPIEKISPNRRQTYQARIGGREMTIRTVEPVFTTDLERANKKREIEAGLYKVFSKYISASTGDAARRT